jgi:hypothetical protein
MTNIQLNANFNEVLEPLGRNAANFFLAASLYYAQMVSFTRAAELAGLSVTDFLQRLREHFQTGFVVAEEVVLADLELVETLSRETLP